MMRIDSFARSAGVAAVAALAWIPWLVLAGPLVGGPAARAVYLVVVTALYAGGLPKSPSRRASVTLVVGLAGVGLALVARGTPELCVALAVVLGVTRSGFAHRTAPARAVVIEGVLLVGGLVFARFLAGTALAVWGFFLVQSWYFLVGGIEPRRADGHHPDPFEDAWARATEVLERPRA